jgi:integrase
VKKADGPLTVCELVMAYQHHRGPLLSASRRRTVNAVLELFTRHLRPTFRVANIDQHRMDTYVHARRTGALRPLDRRAREAVAPATIRNEAHFLSTVCNWACGFRVATGESLLGKNPIRGLKLPSEANPRRPVARPERYKALAAVADTVDPSGQFALMLAIAWHTGRRINAICHLRASDVLLERDQLLDAFAEAGHDDDIARAWPGGLRWRKEWDKKGYETFSPIPKALRPALTEYRRDKAIIGDGWVFSTAGEATNKARADYLLRKAEKRPGCHE